MRSYGSNNGGRNALPPALAAEAHRLGVMKAKAAARGDLRATKHYDLLLKKLMLDHGILHDPRLGKVWPDRPTRTALAETRIDRLHALDRHEVPPWFRPGYDDRVRLRGTRGSPTVILHLATAHEGAAAHLAVRQAPSLGLSVGTGHGAHRDTEVIREVTVGGKARARQQGARLEVLLNGICDR